MQTNLKSIKRYDTGRLVERTNKTSWVVLSLLAVVITICLGPACYTLGYVTASTASPFSPASNAFNDNVKDHARPTDSINALVQDANVTYILQNPCGQSVTEAKEHRCHYDMVEMAWVPLECYDAELEEELRAVRDWRFFRFVNRTGEMSWEDAQRGDFEYLTADWDYHSHHCLYRNYKFFRAVAGRGLSSVSEGIAGWHHMRHCRDIDLDKDERTGKVMAKFWTRFPDCGVRHW